MSEPDDPKPNRPAARARKGSRERKPGAGAARASLQDAHERELARLLSDVEAAHGGAGGQARTVEAIARLAERLAAHESKNDSALPGGELLRRLSLDHFAERLGKLAMRGRSDAVDAFGLDQSYQARVRPLLEWLRESYFQLQIQGTEHLPAKGAALLVCNHGGALPWDGVMLASALSGAEPPRQLRWLLEDVVFHAPFLGPVLSRIGAARACQENAQRLLESGELVAVFPEGVKGMSKPFTERYRLQRFGRGGHIKLALRTGVPIFPVAIAGADETYPLLYKVRAFSKLLGLPFIPVTPTFPWLGPFGLLPLPAKFRIRVGPQIAGLEGLGPEAAADTVLVHELNERVRAAVQGLLERALTERGSSAYGSLRERIAQAR